MLSMFGQAIGFVQYDAKTDQNAIPHLLCEAYRIAQIVELNLLKLHSQQEVNYDSDSGGDRNSIISNDILRLSSTK